MTTRRTAALIAAAGALLFVASIAGRVGDRLGLAVGPRWLDHPVLIGGPALVVLTLGLTLLARGTVTQVSVAVGGSLLAAGYGVVATLLVLLTSWVDGRYSAVANPDDTLRTRVTSSGLMDSTWTIRVEQHGHLVNRSRLVGCSGSVDGVRWADGDLVVETETGEVRVAVDEQGRPGAMTGTPAALDWFHAC